MTPSVCSFHASPACAEVEGGELSNFFTAGILLMVKMQEELLAVFSLKNNRSPSSNVCVVIRK